MGLLSGEAFPASPPSSALHGVLACSAADSCEKPSMALRALPSCQMQLELALELRVSRRREAHAELITGLESELRTRPLARAVVGHEELCHQLV